MRQLPQLDSASVDRLKSMLYGEMAAYLCDMWDYVRFIEYILHPMDGTNTVSYCKPCLLVSAISLPDLQLSVKIEYRKEMVLEPSISSLSSYLWNWTPFWSGEKLVEKNSALWSTRIDH